MSRKEEELTTGENFPIRLGTHEHGTNGFGKITGTLFIDIFNDCISTVYVHQTVIFTQPATQLFIYFRFLLLS